MQEEYKYYAFISYNFHDVKWGKKLQRKLEGYKMSAILCREHGWKRKPLNPIFFAPTDIQPGPLSHELQERLRASKNLIVICSPHSARSQWVGREIEYFYNLGRADHIYFFIVDGAPHSDDPETECFNPVIEKLGFPEILGANIHENIYRIPYLNRERAYVQLITKLLGIEFDSIWKRHKRQLLRNCIICFFGILCFCGMVLLVWNINRPVDISVLLTEGAAPNRELPPLKDATVSIRVANEIKSDTISGMEDEARFLNIPKKYMGKEAHIKVTCKDYLPIDTTIILTKKFSILMNRDRQVYGRIHFRLWNVNLEKVVPDRYVEVNGIRVKSDSLGFVDLSVALDDQKQKYIVRSDEIELIDSLVFMPCGESDVICVK